jgi:hypothetical protein
MKKGRNQRLYWKFKLQGKAYFKVNIELVYRWCQEEISNQKNSGHRTSLSSPRLIDKEIRARPLIDRSKDLNIFSHQLCHNSNNKYLHRRKCVNLESRVKPPTKIHQYKLFSKGQQENSLEGYTLKTNMHNK